MRRPASLRSRIVTATGLMLLVIGAATLYTGFATAELARILGLLFKGNLLMEEVRGGLAEASTALTGYLTTKSSDYLRTYIQESSRLASSAGRLNREVRNDEALLLQRSLGRLIDRYLADAEAAVQAKRGRNVAAYTKAFEGSERDADLARGLVERLESMNLSASLAAYAGLDERVGAVILTNAALVVAAVLTAFMIFVRWSYSVTGPLLALAEAAKGIAMGDYSREIPRMAASEEIATTAEAFENMRASVRRAFEELRSKAEVERRLIEEELRLVDLDRRLKDAELLALQSQINPHFLFNTLAAGLQLSLSEGADRTADFLEKLAGFIRYSLRPVSRSVSVGDEIECVERYVWLLRLRFGPRYRFDVQAEEAVLGQGTPALILQPLVENAVAHGLRDRESGGRVRVSARLEGPPGESATVLEVSDNGQGMGAAEIAQVFAECGLPPDGRAGAEGPATAGTPPSTLDPPGGIGLHNVIRRVSLATMGRGRVEIVSEAGGGTLVRVVLPAGGTAA